MSNNVTCPNCDSLDYRRVLIIDMDNDDPEVIALLANAGFCEACYCVQEDFGP